jgi:hypothetical protein
MGDGDLSGFLRVGISSKRGRRSGERPARCRHFREFLDALGVEAGLARIADVLPAFGAVIITYIVVKTAEPGSTGTGS